MKDPEQARFEAGEKAAEAKREAEDQHSDATRHERLVKFGMVMKQKRYLPEDVRDLMDKHLTMRDMMALKSSGFSSPTNTSTRSKQTHAGHRRD